MHIHLRLQRILPNMESVVTGEIDENPTLKWGEHRTEIRKCERLHSCGHMSIEIDRKKRGEKRVCERYGFFRTFFIRKDCGFFIDEGREYLYIIMWVFAGEVFVLSFGFGPFLLVRTFPQWHHSLQSKQNLI